MEHHANLLEKLSIRFVQHTRLALIGTAILTFLALGFSQTASAALDQAIKPLHSPPPLPAVIVKLTCDWEANPTCYPVAVSTQDVRITSHFYIDGKDVGAANMKYKKVCTTYHLSVGNHSGRVYAQDKRGNTADTGMLQGIIKCFNVRHIDGDRN